MHVCPQLSGKSQTIRGVAARLASVSQQRSAFSQSWQQQDQAKIGSMNASLLDSGPSSSRRNLLPPRAGGEPSDSIQQRVSHEVPPTPNEVSEIKVSDGDIGVDGGGAGQSLSESKPRSPASGSLRQGSGVFHQGKVVPVQAGNSSAASLEQ